MLSKRGWSFRLWPFTRGLTAKLRADVDALGLLLRIHPMPGHSGDCPQTKSLLNGLQGVQKSSVCRQDLVVSPCIIKIFYDRQFKDIKQALQGNFFVIGCYGRPGRIFKRLRGMFDEYV